MAAEARQEATAQFQRVVDRSRVYSSIVDQVIEAIRSGTYPPGSRLPAERQLATTLGVSRGSVREAVRILEHTGVLEVRTGSGTYVAEGGFLTAATVRARATLLGEHSPLDVIVARAALEPVTARLAAGQRRDSDLVALELALDELALAIERGENDQRQDFAFHLAIAIASYNPVVVELFGRLTEIMRHGMWRELADKLRTNQEYVKTVFSQHQEITSLIRDRNSDGAEHAMRRHLDYVSATVLVEIEHA
jgi:GntR family transcriptional repressor for pyruvate dehydrogenase complex